MAMLDNVPDCVAPAGKNRFALILFCAAAVLVTSGAADARSRGKAKPAPAPAPVLDAQAINAAQVSAPTGK